MKLNRSRKWSPAKSYKEAREWVLSNLTIEKYQNNIVR